MGNPAKAITKSPRTAEDKIDELVYVLYGLSEGEIGVVGGSR